VVAQSEESSRSLSQHTNFLLVKEKGKAFLLRAPVQEKKKKADFYSLEKNSEGVSCMPLNTEREVRAFAGNGEESSTDLRRGEERQGTCLLPDLEKSLSARIRRGWEKMFEALDVGEKNTGTTSCFGRGEKSSPRSRTAHRNEREKENSTALLSRKINFFNVRSPSVKGRGFFRCENDNPGKGADFIGTAGEKGSEVFCGSISRVSVGEGRYVRFVRAEKKKKGGGESCCPMEGDTELFRRESIDGAARAPERGNLRRREKNGIDIA